MGTVVNALFSSFSLLSYPVLLLRLFLAFSLPNSLIPSLLQYLLPSYLFLSHSYHPLLSRRQAIISISHSLPHFLFYHSSLTRIIPPPLIFASLTPISSLSLLPVLSLLAPRIIGLSSSCPPTLHESSVVYTCPVTTPKVSGFSVIPEMRQNLGARLCSI